MNLSKNLIMVSVLLFTACYNDPKPTNINPSIVEKSKEPLWLDNPYIENDAVAAIGCARRNFHGKVAQKKKAESIALDEIALQVNTKVSNTTLRNKKYRNGKQVSSRVDSNSLQTVKNVELNTKIKAHYTKENGDICAWIVLR